MAQISPKIELKHALSLLKQGKTLESLKKLDYLKDEMRAQRHPDLSTVILNHSLALNMLFDRNLAATKESLYHEDELNTAVILMNLMNLYEILRNLSSENDRVLQKKFLSFSQLSEKWALKNLGMIKSTEIQKRHFKKRFELIRADFEFITSIFLEYFLKIIEQNSKKSYNIDNINKTVQDIYKEIIKEYINLAKESLKKKNIINAIQILNECKLIYEENLQNTRINQLIIDLQRKIDDLIADYYIKAGYYYRENKNFKESAKFFRKGFNFYRIQHEKDKQEKAKKEYLKTCVKFGQNNLELAKLFGKKGDNENAILHFQKSMESFKTINAKKENLEAISQYNRYLTQMGDKEYKKGEKIETDTLNDLNQKINQFQNAMEMYSKAENSRKLKELNNEISRLQKQKMKFLQKEVQKTHRNKSFNAEFLYLEELHLLCYELEMVSKAQHYAEQLEKLKPKVDLEQVEHLRTQKFDAIPWLEQDKRKETSNYNKTQLISPGNFKAETVILDLPNIFNENLESTTINNFIPNVHETETTFNQSGKNIINSPFPSSLLQETIKFNKFSDKKKKSHFKELKKVNQIVKKFNLKGFLEENEIQMLQMYGLNLPKQIIYFHKYPGSNYQFYVLKTTSKFPKILMIPTKNLIKRKIPLGLVVNKINPFINISSNFYQSPEILEDHIRFALNHPHWDQNMDGFQYSTLNRYFYFLHALRIFSKQNASLKEVAKYINSSLVAEYLNINTEKLEIKLQMLQSIKFFEEIFSWSDDLNVRLFFMGFYYYSRKNYVKASILWCKLLVS